MGAALQGTALGGCGLCMAGVGRPSLPTHLAALAGTPPPLTPCPKPARLPLTHPPCAARESGHISRLVSLLNSKTGEVQRARPRCLLKGQSAVVEVTPARPLCLEDYLHYRTLGRVALRDGGRTIAVGIVTRLPGEEAPSAA